jgi:ornithine cyclodeaminase
MKILIINQAQVQQLLPMDECMNVMAEVLKTLSRGDTINPLRHGLWLPKKVGALLTMPAYWGDIKAMGLKVLSVFPCNQGTEYDALQGAVLLFETTHGCLLAIIDASEITAIRTAAVSGVATQLLAREEAVISPSSAPGCRPAHTWRRCCSSVMSDGCACGVVPPTMPKNSPTASRSGTI